MSKKNPDQLINAAKEEFKDKFIVAFIGDTHYGKTVVSTLLYDSLFHYFLPKNPDKYNARVTKGFNTLYQSHKLMNDGTFPPANLPGPIPEIAIEISSREGLGGKIELFLRDMSGEDYQRLLRTEYADPVERLVSLLNEKSPNPNMPGPFSYLAFAKMYVFLVDCSIIDKWPSEDILYGQIIKSIWDLRKGADQIANGKIAEPFAILLTKSDTLQENIQGTPREIIREKAPHLYANLEEACGNGLDFFKLGVEAEIASPADIEQMNQKYVETRKIEQAELEKQIEEEVQKAAAEARQAAQAAASPPDQVEEAARKAALERRNLLSSKAKQENTESSITQKVKKPLTYTHSEYIRFISWILRTMSKK